MNTYDVNDIDGCDEVIYRNMKNSLREGYDFMVGHFLALDHVGHSISSINNSKMEDQISKISKFIEEII